MATIDITHPHTMSIDEARSKAEFFIREIKSSLPCEMNWLDTHTLEFASSSGMTKGTSGTLVISAKDIKIALDLPLMLRGLKGMVEKQIRQKLERL